MTKIDFEFETEYGVYKDALYLSEEEQATLTEQDIEAIKQARVDNWIAIVSAPPPVEEIPVEEPTAETPLEEVITDPVEEPAPEEVVETPV